MKWEKGDEVQAKHPTKGWKRGKVRGIRGQKQVDITWIDGKGWNRVNVDDVKKPEDNKKSKPASKRGRVRSTSSSSDSSEKKLPATATKKGSNSQEHPILKIPTSGSIKQKIPPAGIELKRMKLQPEQDSDEDSIVDVNELTTSLSGNIISLEDTVLSKDIKKVSKQDIIKSLFRLYSVSRRKCMTFAEVRRVIKTFTHQDVAIICTAAPAFFRYAWNPLSSTERILKDRGAAILDPQTSLAYQGYNLTLTLVKVASEKDVSSSITEAKKLLKKKKIPEIDPPPETTQKQEKSLHTREVSMVKLQRSSLLDACKQVRTVGEVTTLEDSIEALKQQLVTEQKSLSDLKSLSKAGPQSRTRRAKYQSSIKNLKQQIEDKIISVGDKKKYLQKQGNDYSKTVPKKSQQGLILPATVEASAHAHNMQQEAEPELLKLLRVGQQKEGLQTLSCLLLQYAVVNAKGAMLPTQLDLLIEITTIGKLPNSLIKSLRQTLSGIGLGDTGYNTDLCNATEQTGTLRITCGTSTSGYLTLAWQLIAADPSVDELLSENNLVFSRRGDVGIVSVKTGKQTKLLPETVRSIAIQMSSCLKGSVLAAVDAQGVPNDQNSAAISIIISTEQQQLQRALKATKVC